MSILSAKRLRRLSLGLPTLDNVFPGLEPGDFAVLRGNAAPFMCSVLGVRVQLSYERGGLASCSIFVDGGNSFNLYEIASVARDYSLDCKETLEKIYVSRAFTVHQLSSLILEKLDAVLKETRAKLLIVSDITSLFSDSGISAIEARELFIKACSKLAAIAVEKQIVVVASYFPENKSKQSLFLEAFLFGKSNVLIKLRRKGRVLRLTFEDHPYIGSLSMDFMPDQSSSRVYGGVGFGENRPIL